MGFVDAMRKFVGLKPRVKSGLTKKQRELTTKGGVQVKLGKYLDKDGKHKVKVKAKRRRAYDGFLLCRLCSCSVAHLRTANLVGALVSMLCAIADVVLLFGAGWDRSIDLYSVANVYKDVDGSDEPAVRVELAHEGALSLGMMLLLTALLDAFFMILPVVWSGYEYERKLREGVHPLQLIQYSLSASTAFVAIMLVTGAHDAMALTSGVGLTMATMLFGHLAEEINARPKEVRRKILAFRAHMGGWLCMCTAWIVVAASFYESISLSDRWPPFFVFLIVAGMGGAYAYFGIAQAAFIFGLGTSRRWIEAINVFMSPACKLYIHVILFSYVFAP